MPNSVLLPLTNVYAKGDFTARVHIGSEQQVANLILDTGSSTMVVQHEDFNADKDAELKGTPFVQDVSYGMGGWYGPVVNTRVSVGQGAHSAVLTDTHIAVTQQEKAGCFGQSDGLLGLAYHGLNPAYDVSDYLREQDISPAVTYPWHLEQQDHDDIQGFRTFAQQYPRQDITPFFTQLESEGIVANKFAFIAHRASIFQVEGADTPEKLASHPLNTGWCILGCHQDHNHMHGGVFVELPVKDDKYYNVELVAMQIGDQTPVPAPELSAEHKGYVSNAIIDTGASMIMLPKALFDGLFSGLIAHNADFEALLAPFRTFTGKEVGIDIQQVQFTDWPDIHFIFKGIGGKQETLTMTPQTYWQTHAPAPDQVSFQFVYIEKWPNQAVLGLPFIINYFTVFDRSDGEKGAVLFAEKTFSPHLLDTFHHDVEALRQQFTHHKQLHPGS